MAGFISVYGLGLEEAAFCQIDAYGNFCAGPIVPGQEEIEEQIQDGCTSGSVQTSEGIVYWEYRG